MEAGHSVVVVVFAFNRLVALPFPMKSRPVAPAMLTSAVQIPSKANRELGLHAEHKIYDLC